MPRASGARPAAREHTAAAVLGTAALREIAGAGILARDQTLGRTGALHAAVGMTREFARSGPLALEPCAEPRICDTAGGARTDDVTVVAAAQPAAGVTIAGEGHVAFACEDVVGFARRAREAGAPVLDIPDNYYDDLDARFALAPELLAAMRATGVLYDRDGVGLGRRRYRRRFRLGLGFGHGHGHGYGHGC